ncbi:MAG: FG-GAP-like repeat-containing protein [Planctomycetota bacterium]|nr:FG-GAP-like repeat-containing protein [Planctomycetota bacterium]
MPSCLRVESFLVVVAALLLACDTGSSSETGAPPPPANAGPIAPEPPAAAPTPQSADQQRASEAFHLLLRGLAWTEDELKQKEALESFKALIKKMPDEPAGYINAGVALLRDSQLEGDPVSFADKALKLDPESAHAWGIIGFAAYGRRDVNGAAEALSKAIKLNPNIPEFRYRLVRAWAMEAGRRPELREKMATHLEALRTLLPDNILVRVELAETLRAIGDLDGALAQLAYFDDLLPLLGEQPNQMHALAVAALKKGDAKKARGPVLMFQNVLKAQPIYRQAVEQVKPALDGVEVRILSKEAMGRVPVASPPAAIPVKFVAASYPVPGAKAMALLDVNGDGHDDLYVAGAKGHLLVNKDGKLSPSGKETPPGDGISSAIACDLDNDEDIDLILSNEEGLQILLNDGSGGFEEETPENITEAGKGGAFVRPVDYDHDGDLDLFIGRASGPNRLMRNHGDGTYAEKAAPAKIAGGGGGVRAAFGADLDNDGDLDVLVLDMAGGLTLYGNLRQGQFEPETVAIEGGPASAFAVADLDNDGRLDIVAAGAAIWLIGGLEGGKFEARGEITLPQGFEPKKVAAIDYDNDGFQDLAVAGQGGLVLFRNVGPGRFESAPGAVPESSALTDLSVSDMDRDGDLDLVVLGAEGVKVLINEGGNKNHWVDLRFRGLENVSSQGRTNRFALGARAEIRAGDLYHAQTVEGSFCHFGIGSRKKVEAVRIIWANGIPGNEFDLEEGVDVRHDEILRGSCPFLYTWDGERFVFITDVLGGSPLGLRIDEQRFAWIDSEDHLKIRGDQLKPKDGEYVLQMTEELQEVTFYDQAELLVVDHPSEAQIFSSEKWAPPPFSPHQIHSMKALRPLAGALDTRGNDVLDALMEEDGNYVADFRRANYLGIVTPHTLTLDLGDLKGAKRIRLVLTGWMHWPDSSTANLSIAQNSNHEFRPPSLWVPDGSGGWKMAMGWFGGPAGKTKTVVHDLTGMFPSGDFRARIETNLEIYWDQILVSTETGDGPTRVTRLKPSAADIHYRGYSRLYRKGKHSPHLFDYDQVTRESRWRDMEGYCTRYGDVTDLTQEPDNRFVIIGAGDEMTLRFDAKAAPPLPEGWTRDFILRSVGWVKDGDPNTVSSQTVGPLPFHGMSGYPYGPDEAYPDDAEHREFLKEYNTRWMDQAGFRAYVRNGEILRSGSRGPTR